MKSKEEKNYVDMQWALWFYECGVPFNTAAARQFQIAIEETHALVQVILLLLHMNLGSQCYRRL
jgi:hypothetical protein